MGYFIWLWDNIQSISKDILICICIWNRFSRNSALIWICLWKIEMHCTTLELQKLYKMLKYRFSNGLLFVSRTPNIFPISKPLVSRYYSILIEIHPIHDDPHRWIRVIFKVIRQIFISQFLLSINIDTLEHLRGQFNIILLNILHRKILTLPPRQPPM